MNEKERIEMATAEAFLKLYNDYYGTDFRIIKLGDSPDVQCRASNGCHLNLEITQTEDCSRDIQGALGRSDHRNIENLGLEQPQSSSLSGNVLEHAAEQINKKLLKRYGHDTALVVRDSSGVDWEWDEVIDELKERLTLKQNPFDRGIWILNRYKTKFYQIIKGRQRPGVDD